MSSRRTYQVQPIVNNTIAASATANVDVNFIGMQDVTYCLEVVYGTVSGSSGVTVTVFPGFLDTESNPSTIVYADNGTAITGIPVPTTNDETIRFAFALDLTLFGQYARIQVINNDPVNAITSARLLGSS